MARGSSSPPSGNVSPVQMQIGGIASGSNNNQILGMIVDRSSFDEGNEFRSAALHEEDSTVHSDGGGGGGGVVIKNGKVRRRLRWKPPAFRKKKNHFSSNTSVISALTNKSSTTNRSSSTNRTFLSGFSRRSTKSFHTFHSTATPVVTNKAGSKNVTQFPLPRPNYPDTFEGGAQSTIASEGRMLHQRMGSENFNVNEVDVDRCNTLTSRLDSMPPSPMSCASPSNQHRGNFDPYGSSNASVHSDPFDNLEPASPTAIKPAKISLRKPPRFVRKKNNSARKAEGSKGARLSEDSLPHQVLSQDYSSEQPIYVEAKGTAPTIATTASRPSLSASISVERENSVLPTLANEDYEEDRRIGLSIGTPPRFPIDFEEELIHVHGADAAAGGAQNSPMTARSSPSPSSEGASSPVPSKLEERQQSRTRSQTRSEGRISPTDRSRSNSSGMGSHAEAAITPEGSRDATDREKPPQPKQYHRPVDSTTAMHGGVEITASDEFAKDADESNQTIPNQAGLIAPRGGSVPGDVEHNLRAIHDMAAEHLAHGEFAEAIEVFEEILRGQQERYGHNHYRVGTALHNLGIVHLKSGDHQKAIEICSQAVKVRRESLVPDHPDVAVSLAQLGVAHLECSQNEQALMAFREALHIRQTFLGPKHPKCSKILNNIGCALYSLDELENSRLAFQEALDIQRETLRKMPTSEELQEVTANTQSNQILLSIASTLCNIGSIRLRLGQFDDAGLALEEALLIQQSVLGDEHPMVAHTMESIEYVESSQENAIPSANDLLSKWAETGEEVEYKKTAAMCSINDGDPVLLNLKALIGSKGWYKRVEERIIDGACGGNVPSSDEGSANGAKHPSDSIRYSV